MLAISASPSRASSLRGDDLAVLGNGKAHGACSLLHAAGLGYGASMALDLPVAVRLLDSPSKRALDDPDGLLDGVLELIPSARVGFVGLYRDEETHRPIQYYYKVPSELQERRVIAVDPMLATGYSASAAIDLLKNSGAKDIKLMCLVAAPEGVELMRKNHPDVQVVTASLDECLNDDAYIVPGLGDAGDRMFGTK